MFPILNIGGFALQVPGLFILLGIWVGTWLIDREAPRLRINANSLNNLVLIGLVSGIIGARLWYALRFLDIYLDAPASLFSLNPSTLATGEGAVTGLIAAFVYGNRKRLPLWITMDALTPAATAFTIFMGLAHFAGGDAFGSVSSVPWTIELWGAQRHPSQLYEIILSGLILAVILRVRIQAGVAGTTFFTWLALAALGRLFLEAFRGDSVIVLGSLRAAQVTSLGILLAALLAFHLLLRQSAPD
jgi:phosphatidylglycerol:prolipoprotein diacylglycerol transferase